MRKPVMNIFAKKAATVASAALLIGVGLPLAPGMAGAAYACAGPDPVPPAPARPSVASAAPTTPGGKGGTGKASSATTGSTKVGSGEPSPTSDKVDWSKVTLTIGGVPGTVARDREVHARVTVVNGSGKQLGRIPIALSFFLDGDMNPPQGSTGRWAAQPSDVSVRYSYPGNGGAVPLKRQCQGILGGRFTLAGRGAPGTRTTVDVVFTVKSSAPAKAVDSFLDARIDIKGSGHDGPKYFVVADAEAPPPAKPATTTKAPPANVAAETPAATPAAQPPRTEQPTLAVTGGPAALPLSLAGGALVLLGGAALVAARVRREGNRP
ncbi:hypothetical protein [Embleya sp. NBC_00896]|uniref:hypothetical protein n=1 Tax=Embleya sp. NBC_00896 TaxID=2975961 RepID=UPI003870D900|nr:hypothetical protein OG928_16055 [Embleya sp. NBC_00896]